MRTLVVTFKQWFWAIVGAVLIVLGLNGSGALVAVAGFWVILIWVAMRSQGRKNRAINTAPAGSVRVETVKQFWVNQAVQQYAQRGWALDGQSSAKSLGSQARVTLTFRKN